MIHLLMGVMGAGKTTVGQRLAQRLGCDFYDGDDYHPEANLEKMRRGIPLTDADRKPWLFAVRSVIDRELSRGVDAVVTCSALRERYRRMLVGDRKAVHLVHLKGPKDLIATRIKDRHPPDADPALLESQFETLEEPDDALVVDVAQSPEAVVDAILASEK